MTKAGARRFLVAYFVVFFGAVLLRIDYFPLSWVPMYGFRNEEPTLTVAVGDSARRDRGFAAVRANGERLFVSRRDLNMPPANFRRLYQERMFGEGPPQHRRERARLWAFNRWWYRNLIGDDPATNADYPRDILRSANRTLGYGPADPERLVALEVQLDFATFTREALDTGHLDNPQRMRRLARVTEHGTRYITTPIDG